MHKGYLDSVVNLQLSLSIGTGPLRPCLFRCFLSQVTLCWLFDGFAMFPLQRAGKSLAAARWRGHHHAFALSDVDRSHVFLLGLEKQSNWSPCKDLLEEEPFRCSPEKEVSDRIQKETPAPLTPSCLFQEREKHLPDPCCLLNNPRMGEDFPLSSHGVPVK